MLPSNSCSQKVVYNTQRLDFSSVLPITTKLLFHGFYHTLNLLQIQLLWCLNGVSVESVGGLPVWGHDQVEANGIGGENSPEAEQKR